MRIVRIIATPWTPYAVTFSHDGRYVAIGGGTWYGEGGVLLVEMDRSDAAVLIPWEELPTRGVPVRWGNPVRETQWNARAGTVSGLAFSADDRCLAVGTRGGFPRFGPAYVLDLGLTKPSVRAMLVPECLSIHELNAPVTGMLLLEEGLLLRRQSWPPIVAMWPFPPDLHLATRPASRSLTHTGLALVRDTVLTGRPTSSATEPEAPLRNLVTCALDGSSENYIAGPGTARITAIAEIPGVEGFITGGQDGELDRWGWVGGWRSERIQGAQSRSWDRKPGVSGYGPGTVVGLCHLCSGTEWVSVDAGGEVTVRIGAQSRDTWQISVPGSPRSLAAHPTRRLFAIGVKQGGSVSPTSVVLLVQMD